MKGRVLGHDKTTQAIVVRAGDGRRYRFSDFEWRELRPPEKGDEVDFEPDGPRARDVYLMRDASEAPPGAAAVGESPAAMLARQPAVQFAAGHPVLVMALLVLLVCLLPAYSIDGASMSLLAAPELAWRMSLAIDGLVAATGPDPGPRLAGAAARITTVILLLLYAVPVLAAIAAWREFVGGPDRRVARLAGLAAMVLPLALPAVVMLVVRAGVLPGVDVPIRLGRDGIWSPAHVFHPIALYSMGSLLVTVAGAGLWATASGRLPLWVEAARPAAARPHTPEPRAMAGRTAPPPGPASPERAPPDVSEGETADAEAQAAAAAPLPPQAPAPIPETRPAHRSDGPSPEAMTALTQRLRNAISGDRANADTSHPPSGQEAVAVFAPPPRQHPHAPGRSDAERAADA